MKNNVMVKTIITDMTAGKAKVSTAIVNTSDYVNYTAYSKIAANMWDMAKSAPPTANIQLYIVIDDRVINIGTTRTESVIAELNRIESDDDGRFCWYEVPHDQDICKIAAQLNGIYNI
ncbi:MAG: hypothetical protein FWG94_08175 [Oscillospiraceae bacterium]|nr:hypothetical protein [Oscillospiraceae bacterium]